MTRPDACRPAAEAAHADPDAVLSMLAALPTGALFQQLDALVRAMDAADPQRRARRAGWLGRLLGRDLVVQATAGVAQPQVGVHLARAAEAASVLEARLPACATAVAALAAQARAMRATTAPASLPAARDAIRIPAGTRVGDASGVRMDAGDADARRHARRQAMADATLLAAVQADAMLAHARVLLERHLQLRDELVPLWQRHQAARAIDARLRGEEGRAFVALRDAMRGQLDTWRRPPSTTPTFEPLAPPTKDPLP